MNLLRQQVIDKLGGFCERCSFDDVRVLKVITPISRKGKGDASYWSEVKQVLDTSKDANGFKLVCPTCFELDKLDRVKLEPKQPVTKRKQIAVWRGLGFGDRHIWADELEKKGIDVYFTECIYAGMSLVGKNFYRYGRWDTPVKLPVDYSFPLPEANTYRILDV